MQERKLLLDEYLLSSKATLAEVEAEMGYPMYDADRVLLLNGEDEVPTLHKLSNVKFVLHVRFEDGGIDNYVIPVSQVATAMEALTDNYKHLVITGNVQGMLSKIRLRGTSIKAVFILVDIQDE